MTEWVKCEGAQLCKFFVCPHSVWHERNSDCDRCDFNRETQHCTSLRKRDAGEKEVGR